jgi:hypothetical protein
MKKTALFILFNIITFITFSQYFSLSENQSKTCFPKINQKIDTSFVLTHSAHQMIDLSTSVSCNHNGVHYTNSFYRVFDLKNFFNLNSDWSLQEVQIGIAQAVSGTGSEQPLKIITYVMSDYNGEQIIQENLHQKGDTINVTIYNSDAGYIKYMPIIPSVSIPLGNSLVVEIFVPDGTEYNHKLYIGSNDLGQTDNTYIKAPACSVYEPVNVENILYPDMMLVMNIRGAYDAAYPEINNFAIEGQIVETEILNEPDYTVKIIMPADTVLNQLKPEIEIPAGYTISPASGEIIDFSIGPVQYTVTNESSKISQSWMVYVLKAEPDIVGVQIPEQNGQTVIDKNNHSVVVPVPFGTDLTNIAPEITLYQDFNVNPLSEQPQNFSSAPVVYTVSHNTLPLSQAWDISVIEAASDVHSIAEKNITIYPNPVSDFLNISCENYLYSEILSIAGKTLLRSDKNLYNISSLSNGFYIIKIYAEDLIYLSKILKQ